jgi:hypothetical protein
VGPVFDPIKALVHAATSDLVERVIIDGRTVYLAGKVIAWDTPTTLCDAQHSCDKGGVPSKIGIGRDRSLLLVRRQAGGVNVSLFVVGHGCRCPAQGAADRG